MIGYLSEWHRPQCKDLKPGNHGLEGSLGSFLMCQLPAFAKDAALIASFSDRVLDAISEISG